MNFTFYYDNLSAPDFICSVLKKFFDDTPPVIVCIGSNDVLGDSLAPMVGSFLTKENCPLKVYGNLNSLITSINLNAMLEKIKILEPNKKLLVIDSSVSSKSDIGLISIKNTGIIPGLALNKGFNLCGDYSITGIVAEKTNALQSLKNTPLSLIYYMSNTIAMGIKAYYSSIIYNDNILDCKITNIYK